MILYIVLNPEDMHQFEQSKARSKRFHPHKEDLFTTSWNTMSARYKNDSSIEITPRKMTYTSRDDVSAKTEDMKELEPK